MPRKPKKEKPVTAVEKRAGVHERTVQQAEAHAAANAPKRRRRGADKSDRNVSVVRVHPAVMNEARRLARGDMSRVQIRSATEVVVR